MPTEFKHNATLLLSAQRALLGAIYPAIRAVAVGIADGKLYVRCYLDRQPGEDDHEVLSIIATEIYADLYNEVKEIEENCEYSLKPFNELNHLMGFVYVRKED